MGRTMPGFTTAAFGTQASSTAQKALGTAPMATSSYHGALVVKGLKSMAKSSDAMTASRVTKAQIQTQLLYS